MPFYGRLVSISSVCCVLKKLPVKLAATDNPTEEVLPANMYPTSQLGCIISVMFKGYPPNKHDSGGKRLPFIMKAWVVCRLDRVIGLDCPQEGL